MGIRTSVFWTFTTAGFTSTDQPLESSRSTVDRQDVSLSDSPSVDGCAHGAQPSRLTSQTRASPAATRQRLAARARPAGAELTVADDGPGLSTDLAAWAFDRFVRGDAARSRTTGNSGLGLAIARSIVEAHNGAIELETLPGRGCRRSGGAHRYRSARIVARVRARPGLSRPPIAGASPGAGEACAHFVALSSERRTSTRARTGWKARF